MSPRTEEDYQRIREEQRKKIFDAAKGIFAHKGYTDTKMMDIATAAEVSYGLAYHYFASKEALFVSIVEEALRGTISLFQTALTLPILPWERLHWLVSHILDGTREDPDVAMIILQALTNETVPHEAREIAYRQSRLTLEIMRQLIVDGQRAKQVIQGDPDRLTIVFGACIQGLSLGASSYNFRPFDKPFELPGANDVLQILKP